MKLKIKKLIPDLDLRYHSDGASGIDIPAPYDLSLDVRVVASVNCGFCVEIPEGYEGHIRPRSSASFDGLLIHNGTIDSDYRGEIKFVIHFLPGRRASEAHHYDPFVIIKKGERIAQLVIAPVQRCEIEFVDELSETKRGNGGFGSTGK